MTGATEFIPRARLFPLPLVAATVCMASLGSARNRARLAARRLTVSITNRCISTLNSMWQAERAGRAPLFIHSPDDQPDTSSISPSFISAAQSRLLEHLRRQCSTFAASARIGAAECGGPGCDNDAKDLFRAALSSCETEPGEAQTPHKKARPSRWKAPFEHHKHATLPYSTAEMPVVPLKAARVSLPDSLRLVPLASVLPEDAARLYSTPDCPALLRDPLEVQALNIAAPLRRPGVAGSRTEYLRLLARLHPLGMIGFTRQPKAVNGVFTVAKDGETDRLIIDARAANRLFVDSPKVRLPNASHLVHLFVSPDCHVNAGKSDMSNFYHHMEMAEWMQPYFCLPPLSPDEQRALALPCADGEWLYPMCRSLPMGFSHAVYLAQSAHEHIIYSSGAARPEDNIMHEESAPLSPGSGRIRHGIYIDDYF
jgi:hypothetical protein